MHIFLKFNNFLGPTKLNILKDERWSPDRRIRPRIIADFSDVLEERFQIAGDIHLAYRTADCSVFDQMSAQSEGEISRCGIGVSTQPGGDVYSAASIRKNLV